MLMIQNESPSHFFLFFSSIRAFSTVSYKTLVNIKRGGRILIRKMMLMMRVKDEENGRH